MSMYQGHPTMSTAHFSSSKHPPLAALAVARRSHGHDLLTAHWKVARLPFAAAFAQVNWSQGHPLSRAHWRSGRWPPRAADEHVLSSQGQPFARAHFSTESLPNAALPEQNSSRIGIAARLDLSKSFHKEHTKRNTGTSSLPVNPRIVSMISGGLALSKHLGGHEKDFSSLAYWAQSTCY